jgi:Protein of unknown function (DUF1275)
MRLGGVFTSVMTGNMVLLGVSEGERDASLALHAGAALVGYVLGTLLGARIAGEATPQQSVWPRAITVALFVELAVFVVFGVWWELAGGHPSGTATYVLIGSNALALGIQSSAIPPLRNLRPVDDLPDRRSHTDGCRLGPSAVASVGTTRCHPRRAHHRRRSRGASGRECASSRTGRTPRCPHPRTSWCRVPFPSSLRRALGLTGGIRPTSVRTMDCLLS